MNSAQKEIEEWAEYLQGHDDTHTISSGGFTLRIDDGVLSLSQDIVDFYDDDGFTWVDRDASLW